MSGAGIPAWQDACGFSRVQMGLECVCVCVLPGFQDCGESNRRNEEKGKEKSWRKPQKPREAGMEHRKMGRGGEWKEDRRERRREGKEKKEERGKEGRELLACSIRMTGKRACTF